jgi:DNA-binding NarL/FixJ family response regulator
VTRETATDVLVVEDDGMARAWLRLALEDSEFRLAGEAVDAAEALDLIERRRPAIVLVDYRLEDAVSTQLVREFRRRGFEGHVVVMTTCPADGLNESAREAGAQGTLLKTGQPEELLETLRRVAAGEESFDVRHPRRSGLAPPSPREREVLRLIATGATNREAATALGVGVETVKTLLARTYGKLGTHRRAEAVSVAQRLGLL